MVKNPNTFENIERVVLLVFRPWKELYYGVRYNSIPWEKLLSASAVVALILTSKIDHRMIKFFSLGFMYPYYSGSYWAYYFGLTILPFYIWGISQVIITEKLSRRLAQAFQVSGLVNRLGKVPSLLSNFPIDNVTKKLKLTAAHLPISKFKEAKEYLESSLNVYVDKISSNVESGVVEILYSPFPMPSMVDYGSFRPSHSCDFWIGNTRAERKIGSFLDTPHLLIAGQTGGGKSTFIRQLITTIFVNDKTSKLALIDLKGGLDSTVFEDIPRIQIAPTIETAIPELAKMEKTIHARMKLLKENKCKDISAYHERLKQTQGSDAQSLAKQHLARHYFIIDEAAELFLANQSRKSDDVHAARRVVSLIARQGRAIGLHLVVATQRPDSRALDPQVKANLTGVLCFPVANDASSISVLGNGRATDLPDVKGRAIWKNGMEMLEVQTPYISVEEVQRLIRPTDNTIGV